MRIEVSLLAADGDVVLHASGRIDASAGGGFSASSTGGVSPNLSVPLFGSDDGTTRSAIAAGTLEVRDDAAQRSLTGQSATEAAGAANRDTAGANGGLANDFSAEKLAKTQELVALIGCGRLPIVRR